MNLSPPHAAAGAAANRSTSAIAHQARRYSSDAYSYSLPGGIVKGSHEIPVKMGTAVSNGDSGRGRTRGIPATATVSERDQERTLVVTDVACDLPLEWLVRQNVLVLPIRIRFESKSRADTGDVAAAREFFRRDLPQLGRDAQALALSASGTQDFVEPHLATHIDYVLEIAQASSRGSGYMNSLVAAQNLMLQHGRARRQLGTPRPFKMWVIDAATALSGQGVLVSETVRALQEGLSVPRVVQHVDSLRKCVYTLAVPGDIARWYRHNSAETEASFGWLNYGVGKMLDRTPVVALTGSAMNVVGNLRNQHDAIARALAITTAQVRKGLAAPVTCVSYAGDTDLLRQREDFVVLEDACARHGATLHVATMSLTNALSLGQGGVSIAFASERFEG